MRKVQNSENYQVIKRMLSYLIPCKRQFLAVVLCLAGTAIIGFYQPLIIRVITDQGMQQLNLDVIIRFACLLLGLVVLSQLLEVLQTRVFAGIHNVVKNNLFTQGFRKLLHLKAEYFSDRNGAEVIDSMQTDVARTSLITDQMFVMLVSFIFRGFSGLAGLLVMNWKLSLIVLLMVPIKYFSVKILAKKQEQNIERQIERNREFAGWFSDNINGIAEIKLWRLADKKLMLFEKKQKTILAAERKQTMLEAWNSFVEVFLEWFVTCLLYVLGGVFILNGTLTIGGVFAFISYSGYVTGPISAVLNLRMILSTIFPSAKRLFSFFDMEEEEDNRARLASSAPRAIEFRDVCFRYNDKQVLKGVNLRVDPGEKIAIIGPNGSGKTTILNLLLRFIKPQGGCIAMGGQDIWSVGLDEYRRQFTVVSQDPYLFQDSVKNNIDLRGQAGAETFAKACRQSGASAFIDRLDEKENSLIGANGAKLSGGERQKLAVARAMLNDAPIVILDEATSAYDVESDDFLQSFIQDGLQGKTVIMITHKYQHLGGMDKVYEIKDGELHPVHRTQDCSRRGSAFHG